MSAAAIKDYRVIDVYHDPAFVAHGSDTATGEHYCIETQWRKVTLDRPFADNGRPGIWESFCSSENPDEVYRVGDTLSISIKDDGYSIGEWRVNGVKWSGPFNKGRRLTDDEVRERGLAA